MLVGGYVVFKRLRLERGFCHKCDNLTSVNKDESLHEFNSFTVKIQT